MFEVESYILGNILIYCPLIRRPNILFSSVRHLFSGKLQVPSIEFILIIYVFKKVSLVCLTFS